MTVALGTRSALMTTFEMLSEWIHLEAAHVPSGSSALVSYSCTASASSPFFLSLLPRLSLLAPMPTSAAIFMPGRVAAPPLALP